ncbi:MAG: ComF family protein [Parvularculaceae bacterium]
MNAVADILTRALDLVLPPRCPLTQEELVSHGALGAAAWGAAHFIEAPFCARCGVPFAADYGAEVECPSCIAAPPDFDRARAALVYNDASYKLIVGFKHSDRTELARMFGEWMARAGKGLLSSASVLTPVPLHAQRLRSRRYNQSALLAQAVAKQSGAALSLDDLVRRRATPPQKDLSADARRRNVAGAFGFRSDHAKARFKGAHVVLIDDVLTTGATLSAAARTLKRAGAAKVDALVLARVIKGGVGAL